MMGKPNLVTTGSWCSFLIEEKNQKKKNEKLLLQSNYVWACFALLQIVFLQILKQTSAFSEKWMFGNQCKKDL